MDIREILILLGILMLPIGGAMFFKRWRVKAMIAGAFIVLCAVMAFLIESLDMDFEFARVAHALFWFLVALPIFAAFWVPWNVKWKLLAFPGVYMLIAFLALDSNNLGWCIAKTFLVFFISLGFYSMFYGAMFASGSVMDPEGDLPPLTGKAKREYMKRRQYYHGTTDMTPYNPSKGKPKKKKI